MTDLENKPQEKPRVVEISKGFDLGSFDCGQESINDYLSDYAWQNHRSGRARTYIACNSDNDIMGFYSLCPAEISYDEVVISIKAGQPKGQKIPVFKIAQLGVDKKYQGVGIGRALFKDALLNCYNASKIAGGRAVIIDAIDDDIVSFYANYGFEPATKTSNILMLKISKIEKNMP